MRTIEIFVKEMIAKGRTLMEIKAIANSTRWKNYMAEIESIYNKQLSSRVS